MGDVILFGISLNNPQFSEENIYLYLKYFHINRPRAIIYIIVPDQPTIYNYLALGYNFKEAAKKLKKKAYNMKNKILRVLRRLEEDFADSPLNYVYLNWNFDISTHEAFSEKYGQILENADNRARYFRDIYIATEKVLRDHPDLKINEPNIHSGMIYVFKELAMILSFRKIFSISGKIIVTYPRKWEIFENLVSGAYPEISEDEQNLGFFSFT